MRTRPLRRIVRAAVAVLPAVALAGCAADGDSLCHEPVEVAVTLTPPFDPPTQLRVEGCRVDRDACRELCVMVMRRQEISAPFAACTVAFRDPEIDLAITYLDETDVDRCELADGFLEDDAP